MDQVEEKPRVSLTERVSFSSVHKTDFDSENANLATDREHEMSLMEAIRAYPWALFWGVILSMALVMESYDMMLMSSFLAFPSFIMKFGNYHGPKYGYQIPVQYQIAFGFAAIGGCVVGGALNGWIAPRYGFRNTYRVGMILMIIFTFPLFFAPDLKTLVIGEVLCGLPWGMFATLVPAYLAETCPLAFRSYMTAYVSICFATGQFIASGVVQGLVHRTDQWGYRIPFALQWIWPPPLLLAAWFAPESPWWLVRKGRIDEAEKAALRFQAKSTPAENAKQAVALMIRTNEAEKASNIKGSYLDCFKGVNLRRTEIACIVFVATISVGQTFAYTPTYFFVSAGIPRGDAYKLGLGSSAISFVGTVLSWFAMANFGRRTMMLAGGTFLSVALLLVGILSQIEQTHAALYGQGALCLVWTMVFSITVIPMGWSVPAEIAATRLRQETFALARVSYYLALLVSIALQMHMMNPTKWNWAGAGGFFWAGTCILTTIWAYFRMPESKGRTFEELDILFDEKISARNFSAYDVGDHAAHLGEARSKSGDV